MNRKSHKNPGETASDLIGTRLAETLRELIDLELISKQLHWAVTGSQFRPLHEQFDELAGLSRELGDVVAERALALGVVPDGQVRTVANTSLLEPIEAGAIADRRAVELIVNRLELVAANVRARISELEGLDPVSQDVLIDTSRELYKQLWMLRVQLS